MGNIRCIISFIRILSLFLIASTSSSLFVSDSFTSIVNTLRLFPESDMSGLKSIDCDSGLFIFSIIEDRNRSSSGLEKGLWIHPVKPALMKFSFSSSPLAVMAAIGMLRELPILELRSRLSRLKPLVPGICISVSIRS